MNLIINIVSLKLFKPILSFIIIILTLKNILIKYNKSYFLYF